MHQQSPQIMNPSPSTPLNLVSTDQIQNYLEENKSLIMAIIESQHKGKVAECAQYQAILQKNLMYLAAIADAQPQGSTVISQLPTGGVALQPQGNSLVMQTQTSTVQAQSSGPIAKLPFQLNAMGPQVQQNQLQQFQQQRPLQGHLSPGGSASNGIHLLMQPGVGNSGRQPGGLLDGRK